MYTEFKYKNANFSTCELYLMYDEYKCQKQKQKNNSSFSTGK